MGDISDVGSDEWKRHLPDCEALHGHAKCTCGWEELVTCRGHLEYYRLLRILGEPVDLAAEAQYLGQLAELHERLGLNG